MFRGLGVYVRVYGFRVSGQVSRNQENTRAGQNEEGDDLDGEELSLGIIVRALIPFF